MFIADGGAVVAEKSGKRSEAAAVSHVSASSSK